MQIVFELPFLYTPRRYGWTALFNSVFISTSGLFDASETSFTLIQSRTPLDDPSRSLYRTVNSLSCLTPWSDISCFPVFGCTTEKDAQCRQQAATFIGLVDYNVMMILIAESIDYQPPQQPAQSAEHSICNESSRYRSILSGKHGIFQSYYHFSILESRGDQVNKGWHLIFGAQLNHIWDSWSPQGLVIALINLESCTSQKIWYNRIISKCHRGLAVVIMSH